MPPTLFRAGVAFGAAIGIALVADTLSITTMEIVDSTRTTRRKSGSRPAPV